MKISNLSTAQRAVIAASNGMTNYLKSLKVGRNFTPHSWLYEGQDSKVTLDKWLRHLHKLEQGSPFEQKVYQFDTKQIEKFGPQGGVPPLDEALAVESFQEQYIPNKACEIPLRPLTEILNCQSGSIRYWDYPFVIDDMATRDTLTSNSGWPDFRKRELVRDRAIRQAESGAAWNYPAIILFRQYNGKLRVVWMYPMAMNLIEYRATMPLQRLVTKLTKYVTPWAGFEHVKARFTELWSRHPFAFGGDTTAMDAHMQGSQLQMVANMSAPLFQDPTLMTESLLHVANIDLIVADNGIIRNQQHGIASGSGWTQLSETIFQIGMFDKYIQMNRLPLSVEDGMGIGDDYVWFFDDQPDAKDIVEFWDANGLPGKEEKQSNEKDYCTFLQRLFYKKWFSRDDPAVLGGIYPTVRALNSLLHPERFHNPEDWSSDMFCTRCYMILENCVDHPLFEQFVRFVVRGQKDLLPFARKASDELRNIQSQARRLHGLTPTYNQEKRFKPLSEFSSIKYARTL